jgi:hypothetical protein
MVLNLKPGEKCKVLFLGEWLQVTMHYDPTEKRGYPHQRQNCPRCDLPQEWRAYVPALGKRWKCTGHLEAAEQGYYLPQEEMVIELRATTAVAFAGRPLRGVVAALLKPPGDKRQPLRVEIEQASFAGEFPPAFDVRPILCRVWRNPHAFDVEPTAEAPPATLPLRRAVNG